MGASAKPDEALKAAVCEQSRWFVIRERKGATALRLLVLLAQSEHVVVAAGGCCSQIAEQDYDLPVGALLSLLTNGT